MCQLYINTSAASAISLSLYYNRDIIQIYFINEFRKTDFMGNIPPHWLQDCWQWLVIQELVSHSPLFAQILQYLCSSRHRPFSVDKVPTLDFYILNFMLNISWCAWNIKYLYTKRWFRCWSDNRWNGRQSWVRFTFVQPVQLQNVRLLQEKRIRIND